MIKEIVFFNFTYSYNCTFVDQDILSLIYIDQVNFQIIFLFLLKYIFIYFFYLKKLLKTSKNYFFLIFIIHRKTNSLK